MREAISHLLWIGNAREARDLKSVLDLGISAIIDVALEEPPISVPREIVYLRLPLIDGDENRQPILETAIDTLVRFIQADVPTLVSCSAGMSRSPAIVAGALAKFKAIPLEDSVQQVASLGPCDISPGLWNQIEAYLKQK